MNCSSAALFLKSLPQSQPNLTSNSLSSEPGLRKSPCSLIPFPTFPSSKQKKSGQVPFALKLFTSNIKTIYTKRRTPAICTWPHGLFCVSFTLRLSPLLVSQVGTDRLDGKKNRPEYLGHCETTTYKTENGSSCQNK